MPFPGLILSLSLCVVGVMRTAFSLFFGSFSFVLLTPFEFFDLLYTEAYVFRLSITIYFIISGSFGTRWPPRCIALSAFSVSSLLSFSLLIEHHGHRYFSRVLFDTTSPVSVSGLSLLFSHTQSTCDLEVLGTHILLLLRIDAPVNAVVLILYAPARRLSCGRR